MLKRFVALWALLLIGGGIVLADCNNVRRQQVVVPAQIVVPSYGAGYQSQQDSELLRQILEELKALRLELSQGGLKTDGLTVVKNECARCHAEQTAGKKGGGFVLFEKDGAASVLSLEQKKLVTLRVSSSDPAQRMPPDRQLADGRRSAVIRFLKGE